MGPLSLLRSVYRLFNDGSVVVLKVSTPTFSSWVHPCCRDGHLGTFQGWLRCCLRDGTRESLASQFRNGVPNICPTPPRNARSALFLPVNGFSPARVIQRRALRIYRAWPGVGFSGSKRRFRLGFEMAAAAFLRHRRDIRGSEQFAILLLDASIPLFNVSVPSAFDHLAVGAIHVAENGGMGIARVGFNCGIGRMVGLGNCGWMAGFGFGGSSR
jgi:hypothetical protein